MHVVVCTVVHHPADARIYFRQIRALLESGVDVTYIAPHSPSVTPDPPATPHPPGFDRNFGGYSTGNRDQTGLGGVLETVTIPRAVGRRRFGALRAARAALASHMAGADLLLVHDPELLLVLPPKSKRPPTVWDVHEDTAAALTTKAWLPATLRPVAAGGVRFAEHLAERRLHLILAEHGYNARFAREHPVVPNTTYVPDSVAPPSGPRRVVYVGHLSPDRGSAEMVELGRLLAPHGISVELVGPADVAARAQLEAGGDAVHWHGFLPNEEALSVTEGALAGLSLLRDEANFRVSMPTKVHEYMARGLPVITTPLPLPVALVDAANCGFVVPFNDAQAAAQAVLKLDADPYLRVAMGASGHEYARDSLGWQRDAVVFVTQLEQWATASR